MIVRATLPLLIFQNRNDAPIMLLANRPLHLYCADHNSNIIIDTTSHPSVTKYEN